MRDIKFRAKAIEKIYSGGIEVGQWVYGYYFVELVDIEDNIRFEYQHFIKTPYGDHFQDVRIDEKTLSEFTGLKDKNGVEIYEGDILKDYDDDCIGVVSFEDGAFIVTCENEFCNAFEWSSEEVIGNIYEHPHLLEVNND